MFLAFRRSMGVCIGFSALAYMAAFSCAASGSNWPGWRGDGSGISDEKNISISWNQKENIIWRMQLEGLGNSSPVVWGNKVFLSAASQDGKRRWVWCFDARTGRTIWKTNTPPTAETTTYPKTGFAAPTPVTDGKRVFVFFDSPGLVALDTLNGKLIWKKDLGPFRAMYNVAGSPVLWNNLIIVSLDQDTESALAGISAQTGELKWRTLKKPQLQWSTPLVIRVRGKSQIISNGPTVHSVDPETGKVIWTCSGLTPAVAPSAVYNQGVVYSTSGRNGPTVAIDPTGNGDVTETHVLMRVAAGGPYVPSPIVYPYLLLPGDNGAIRMVDSKGDLLLEKRIEDHFTASPVAADGHIYWTSERGTTYVLRVGQDPSGRPTLNQVAANTLKENCLASPAISGGRLFIRTDKALYCIAGRKATRVTAAPAQAVLSFEYLKRRYEEHPAFEGPDIAERLGVVEQLGKSQDARSTDFLKQIAKTDIHWDVNEEAAKTLGKKGTSGINALIELLSDPLTFIRVSAAQQLGKLTPIAALEPLEQGTRDNDPQMQVASLDSLATIAAAHRECVPTVVSTMIAACADNQSSVRYAAVINMGRLGKLTGSSRHAVLSALSKAAADPSPLVSRQAKEILARVYGITQRHPTRASVHSANSMLHCRLES